MILFFHRSTTPSNIWSCFPYRSSLLEAARKLYCLCWWLCKLVYKKRKRSCVSGYLPETQSPPRREFHYLDQQSLKLHQEWKAFTGYFQKEQNERQVLDIEESSIEWRGPVSERRSRTRDELVSGLLDRNRNFKHLLILCPRNGLKVYRR